MLQRNLYNRGYTINYSIVKFNFSPSAGKLNKCLEWSDESNGSIRIILLDRHYALASVPMRCSWQQRHGHRWLSDLRHDPALADICTHICSHLLEFTNYHFCSHSLELPHTQLHKHHRLANSRSESLSQPWVYTASQSACELKSMPGNRRSYAPGWLRISLNHVITYVFVLVRLHAKPSPHDQEPVHSSFI